MSRRAWIATLLLMSCAPVGPSFICMTDAQCLTGGSGGRCESTHACSFPAADCPSGRRYDRSAGGGLAGACTDAGGGDAAYVVDAGGGDLGVQPSLCPTFLGGFCQSFEQPISAPWSTTVNGVSMLSLDSSHVYRGTGAGHFIHPAEATAKYRSAQVAVGNLATSGTLYLRGFVYMDTPPPEAFWLFSLHQSGSPNDGIAFNLETNGLANVNENIGPQATGTHSFPIGRWVCVEMSVQLASPGQVHVRIDDVDVPELSLTGNYGVTPPLNGFFAGNYLTTSISAWEMWMDELAIASSPIGCAQ
jgi:hypothetical protein